MVAEAIAARNLNTQPFTSTGLCGVNECYIKNSDLSRGKAMASRAVTNPLPVVLAGVKSIREAGETGA